MSNNFQKEYLIKQIITFQEKTRDTTIMTPIFLEGFTIQQLNQYLETVKKLYVQNTIYKYLIKFSIFLSGFVIGRFI